MGGLDIALVWQQQRGFCLVSRWSFVSFASLCAVPVVVEMTYYTYFGRWCASYSAVKKTNHMGRVCLATCGQDRPGNQKRTFTHCHSRISHKLDVFFLLSNQQCWSTKVNV